MNHFIAGGLVGLGIYGISFGLVGIIFMNGPPLLSLSRPRDLLFEQGERKRETCSLGSPANCILPLHPRKP